MARSTRTLIAVILYVLAGFIAVNNIVSGAVPGDWLLPLALLIAGLIFSLYPGATGEAASHEEAAHASLTAPEPVPTLAAAPAPAPAKAEPKPAPKPVEAKEPEAEAITKASGEAEAVPPAVVEQHPPTRAEVVDAGTQGGTPDDLRKINGVGPKMQTALRNAGYDSFARIAQASEDELRAAIENAGMRLAPNLDTWPAQARELMK